MAQKFQISFAEK